MPDTNALDTLQAIMLLSKHLTDILPFLMACTQVPADVPQRLGLIQETMRTVVGEHELAKDVYAAMTLLAGEDLSAKSLADLMLLAPELLGNGALGDIWGAAYQIGLIDEIVLREWVLYDSLTRGV